MGVTIVLALCVWAASSLVEYKVVSRVPALRVLFHGISGIVISLAIGFLVAIPLGAANGAGFALGQLLGVATNEFTFAFYSHLAQLNERRKYHQQRVQDWKTQHPAVFANAVGSITMGIKAIVGVVLAALWIIGLPFVLARKVATFYQSFRSTDTSARAASTA